MIRSRTFALENRPVATYVVERDPFRGYRVATQEGPESDAHAEAALAALDSIGQPDPRGPQITFRWLGPVPPSHCYVAVWVTMLPSGEARYQQAWYRPANIPPEKSWFIPLLSVICAATGFGGGIAADRWHRPPMESDPRFQEAATAAEEVMREPTIKEVAGPLIAAVADADNPVTVLEQFLGQDGIAAAVDNAGNRSGPEVERVVTLTASQEFRKRVASEKKTFSNYEAAKLLLLFRRLREFVSEVEPKDAPADEADSQVSAP